MQMMTFFKHIAKTHNFTYVERLIFDPPEVEEKIRKRCANKLQKPHLAAYNRWSCSLFEQEWQKTSSSLSLEITKIHPLIGYGVITCERIPAFTYVGEYVGVVRKRRRSDSRNDYAFGYVIGHNDTPWVIDSSEKGNFTRFFNHSYDANLMSRWMISDGLAHIGFFTTKLICAGDELTFDYGPYYWRNRPAPR